MKKRVTKKKPKKKIAPKATAKPALKIQEAKRHYVAAQPDLSANRKKPAAELAFYYPNPIWMNGDWIKNLILFFDGVALLVPKYMKGRIEDFDPAIVAGLKQHDFLHIILSRRRPSTKQLQRHWPQR
jgi:hypothetical protein